MPLDATTFGKSTRVYPKLQDGTYQVVIEDIAEVEKVSKKTGNPYKSLRFRLTVLSDQNDAYGHHLMFTNLFAQMQNKDGSPSPLARIVEAVTGKPVDTEADGKVSAEFLNGLIGKQLAVTTSQVTMTDGGIFEKCEPFGPATSLLPPLDEQKGKEAFGKRMDKLNASLPNGQAVDVASIDF